MSTPYRSTTSQAGGSDLYRQEENRASTIPAADYYPSPDDALAHHFPPPKPIKKKKKGFFSALRSRVRRSSSGGSREKVRTPPDASSTSQQPRGGILEGAGRREPKTSSHGVPTVPSTGTPITSPIPTPEPTTEPGPLPHSVSISSTAPVGQKSTQSQQKKWGGRMSALQSKQSQSAPPNCSVCGKPAYSYISALNKIYHPSCFTCMGCHKIIDPNDSFAHKTDEQGESHPLHVPCYVELYEGVTCTVCKKSIPPGPDGKVSYVKHVFFESERVCPHHADSPGRRCTGCRRFEPSDHGFSDLDSNRCVCPSCCRTVVVDSNDARPLWEKVIDFFESLDLPIWTDMRDVPILVVGEDDLNDQQGKSAHKGTSQIMTRGICLSEDQSGRRIALQKLKFDWKNQSFLPSDPESKGFTYYQVPDARKINPDSSVTAILCLSGLPSDLTAGILAHEATHAWLKLHPDFDPGDPIPVEVEEGCCQLMAQLFLTSGLEPASTETDDDGGPSDAELRRYFLFCIESEEDEVFGDGYRMAATANAQIGIDALLSHVVMYKEFPVVS